MYHKEALPNGCTTANTSVTSITSACSPLSTAPQAGLVSGKLIAGSLSASRELPCPSLFIDEPLNIQKLVVILPPKWPFNIWRGKSEVLLRAGHFHKSMTSFPNPRQGKRSEKKISRLRRGFSYPPLPSGQERSAEFCKAVPSFTNAKTRNIATTYLFTERQALTTNPRAACGREGKPRLSHQSSAELMR